MSPEPPLTYWSGMKQKGEISIIVELSLQIQAVFSFSVMLKCAKLQLLNHNRIYTYNTFGVNKPANDRKLCLRMSGFDWFLAQIRQQKSWNAIRRVLCVMLWAAGPLTANQFSGAEPIYLLIWYDFFKKVYHIILNVNRVDIPAVILWDFGAQIFTWFQQLNVWRWCILKELQAVGIWEKRGSSRRQQTRRTGRSSEKALKAPVVCSASHTLCLQCNWEDWLQVVSWGRGPSCGSKAEVPAHIWSSRWASERALWLRSSLSL